MNDQSLNPIAERIHIAICEDSPEDCAEWRGKCVKAAEAVTDPTRSILVQAAAELNRQWQHATDAYDAKAGPEWTQEHALFCKGKALGAVKALQASMTGPGSIDGNCDEAWKAVDEYTEATR